MRADQPVDSEMDEEPEAEADVFVRAVDLSSTNHSDATGRFAVTSRQGNNYILVSVYKGYVFGVAMPSRKAGDYVKAYECTFAHLNALGHFPTVQRLDNETSGVLERYFRDKQITVRFVPAHNHRANKAERAISDFKNHFIALLGTAHPSCPLSLSDEFLSQANITINLLRTFAPQPSMSAFEGVHGQKYDFLAHPMAPCSTKVLVHKTPALRGSWSPHGTPGFYLGPALGGHYRE
jgi:hypothetical protein